LAIGRGHTNATHFAGPRYSQRHRPIRLVETMHLDRRNVSVHRDVVLGQSCVENAAQAWIELQ
jgi:hypothetical protein